jgi:hypothetical protein
VTSTDLALAERLTGEQLEYISRTELIPKSYRGNVPAIMACVATGRELGIGDMHALRSIHVVDGKATLSAELMVALVRARGHSIKGDFSPSKVTVVGVRGDNADTMTVTWTMEDAERAGLHNRPNWKNYPGAMLWARAVSQLCRMLFPDCFSGVAYIRDEFDDMIVEIPGGALDEPVAALEVSDEVIDAELLDAQDSAGEAAPAAEPAEESLFQPPPPEVEEKRKRNQKTTAE